MLKTIITKIASLLGLTIQDEIKPATAYDDYYAKGTESSYVSMVVESFTSLMLMFFTMPVTGTTERAKWLDKVSTKFVNTKLDKALQSALATGSSVTVPMWDGRQMKHAIIDANGFEYTDNGIIHYVDSFKEKATKYTLLQAIALQPYTAESGQTLQACVMRLYVVAETGHSTKKVELNVNPKWAQYEPVVAYYNVDRPLYAVCTSLASDPNNLNNEKGVPMTFGAAKFIKEMHYLDDQYHNEIELSEKAIIADAKMFKKSNINGASRREIQKEVELPKGQDRVFRKLNNPSTSVDGREMLHDWSPKMRVEDFETAIDSMTRKIEAGCGLSDGVISKVDATHYQNIDHIRKANIKTQAAIDKYRKAAEDYLTDIIYIWDVLANTYNITPTGVWEVDYDWSDQYITSFKDMTEAILAGESIGATDRDDYRRQLFDEPPEVRERKLAEIPSVQVPLAG